MPLSDETADIDEVAAALHRTTGWLRRKWLSLHQRHGFPRKVPDAWVWPRRAVQAWLRSGGFDQPQPMPVNDNGASDPVAAAARALEERYAR